MTRYNLEREISEEQIPKIISLLEKMGFKEDRTNYFSREIPHESDDETLKEDDEKPKELAYITHRESTYGTIINFHYITRIDMDVNEGQMILNQFREIIGLSLWIGNLNGRLTIPTK